MLTQSQPFPGQFSPDVMAAAAYSLMHEPWLYSPSYAPASPHLTSQQPWAGSWSPPAMQHKKLPVYSPVPVNHSASLGYVDVHAASNPWSAGPVAAPRQSSPDAKPGERSVAKKHDVSEKKRSSIEEELSKQSLYKTELCRSFSETGVCRYGHKCQFAHGHHELRPVLRHPKYKTETCRTFTTTGICPYGPRCRFIHPPVPQPTYSTSPSSSPSGSPPAPLAPIASRTSRTSSGSSWNTSSSWEDTSSSNSPEQLASPPATPSPSSPEEVRVASPAGPAESVAEGDKRAAQAQASQAAADDDLPDDFKRLAIFETIAKN